MVDIQSIVASSHPSHHGQDTEGEATSHFGAGRSHQMNTHIVVTATARWQYSAATMAVLPPLVGPEGMLEAEHTLLHNPLGSHASP
jgi:hypothetical protein